MNRTSRGRGNRGRPPNGGGGNRAVTQNQLANLKRQLHGHKNNLWSPAPTELTRRPWYPLVVQKIIAAAGVETFYAPKDIVDGIIGQLGLTDQNKPIIVFKIARVDAWCTPVGGSTDRPAVSMDCSSVTPSLGDPATPGNAEVFYGIMKRLSDQGNLSDAAKVSYSWPLAMADLPISSQTEFTLVSIAGNMPNTCVRFHLLWSTSDIAAPI